MHQPVRDYLEQYLRGRDIAKPLPGDVEAHLAACGKCSQELRVIEKQSALLRTLRPDQETEAPAGFYARLMNRIEAQTPASIWSVFLEPAFRNRIAVASATLALAFGAWIITAEPGDQGSNQPAAVVASAPRNNSADFEDGTPAQQRNDVLVSLASYQE